MRSVALLATSKLKDLASGESNSQKSPAHKAGLFYGPRRVTCHTSLARPCYKVVSVSTCFWTQTRMAP